MIQTQEHNHHVTKASLDLVSGVKAICITMSGWDTLSDHDLDLLEEGSVCSKYDRYPYIFMPSLC